MWEYIWNIYDLGNCRGREITCCMINAKVTTLNSTEYLPKFALGQLIIFIHWSTGGFNTL